MYGFVAATKVDENFMSQVLEHVLLANGVNPVNKEGKIQIDDKKLSESLEFYKAIAKASPPGELFWKQSRELYFAGKAAMIIWSPFIMDELAGLRDSAPPTINSDPKSRELASKTDFITRFSGPSNPDGAAWGDIRYFGITSDADTDNAMEFVKFCMDEGYMNTLAIAPEGKNFQSGKAPGMTQKNSSRDGQNFRSVWIVRRLLPSYTLQTSSITLLPVWKPPVGGVSGKGNCPWLLRLSTARSSTDGFVNT